MTCTTARIASKQRVAPTYTVSLPELTLSQHSVPWLLSGRFSLSSRSPSSPSVVFVCVGDSLGVFVFSFLNFFSRRKTIIRYHKQMTPSRGFQACTAQWCPKHRLPTLTWCRSDSKRQDDPNDHAWLVADSAPIPRLRTCKKT